MRKTDPDLPRPFRTPWVPVLPILGVLINFLLMLGLGGLTWTAFLTWMVIGLSVYFSYSRYHSKLQLR
jgi:APA family basic amino acid/polyamine antiporter